MFRLQSFAVTVFLAAVTNSALAAPPPGSNWLLTFEDEFNSFDSSDRTGVWKTAYEWGPNYTINNELQYYVYTQDVNNTSNVNPFSVSNGILTINADINSAPNNKNYTSGVITTFKSFSQKYGFFEMRAKLPSGKGLWPAFWLLPKNSGSPPELDIMEFVGSQPTTLYNTSHSTVSGEQHCYPKVADMTSGFHTYGFRWDSSTVSWYFDGTQDCQFPTPSDQNQPFYVLLNLGIGSGGWTGTPDSTNVWPAEYQIDYVRVWSQSSTSDTQAPTVPANLTATAVSSSQINLSWTASTDDSGVVAGYDIYRGGTLITSVTGTTYQNTGLAPDTSYSYQIRAKDAAGNTSALSGAASARTRGSNINLALKHPATASSLDNARRPASYAVDGRTNTRWSSSYYDPQWIYVDLGSRYALTRVVLRWEAAYAAGYQIQVSDDASTWTTIYTTSNGDGGTDDIAVTGTGRYVRMYGTSRATKYGYSLWEFEVYGNVGQLE